MKERRMGTSATVYVIDDDPAMRDSLDFLLRSAGYAVHLFESAEAFLASSPPRDAGCVVTDVKMEGLDGIALLQQLRASGHKVPVIVMTGHGDVPLAVRAMKLGATDFIEKPFDADVLVSVVHNALDPGPSRSGTAAPDDELTSRVESLSQRETQVLQGLISGQTNKEIARAFDLSPRTVEVYRAKVMTKMQAGSISELVRLAIKAGISPL
jgi:two-component system response regulator FixJ